jgi:hypothetical protein
LNKLGFILVLFLASFMLGCVPLDSLNPLYTDKDVVFDPTLLGQWGTDTESLNFAKDDAGGYQMSFTGRTDNGQAVSFLSDAHLVNLRGHLFLDTVAKQWSAGPDAFSLKLERNKNGVAANPRFVQVGESAYLEFANGRSDASSDQVEVKFHRAHQFFEVMFEDEGKTLNLIALDNTWVTKQVASGKLVIDHEMVGPELNVLVLTASTPALQKLVLDHVNDSEVFNGTTTVHRPGFQTAAVESAKSVGANHQPQ